MPIEGNSFYNVQVFLSKIFSILFINDIFLGISIGMYLLDFNGLARVMNALAEGLDKFFSCY